MVWGLIRTIGKFIFTIYYEIITLHYSYSVVKLRIKLLKCRNLKRMNGIVSIFFRLLPNMARDKRKDNEVVPLRSIEAHLGDRRYSSYSSLTSALERGEWSASRPGRALPPGKEPPVPIVQEAGWAPEPVWRQRLEEKKSAFVGDRTLVVQSAVRHSANRLARDTCRAISYTIFNCE
jgi:hypothetical protein